MNLPPSKWMLKTEWTVTGGQWGFTDFVM